ncbi:MAG TPA: helix-turn-helix domain-containing protein [Candidatus Acidoferrales bacterium]|jgi:hypothetical protein|nr:helix-turn-helix domain-containing protein [Candidatus Acidoferrales bacterium]
MTQKHRILARLRTGEWLSVVEATNEMFILRLGARIFDLRAEGHNIIERKVAGRSYSEYRLIPPNVPKLPPAFAPKEVNIQALL